jgi:AraC-like DNA-binding protein
MPVERMPCAQQEFARYNHIEPVGVELLHACFDRHRFAPHVHDKWAISAVVRGTKDVAANSSRPMIVSAGELYAIPPHTPHAGRSVSDDGCEYVMIYVPDAEWKMQCEIHGFSPYALSAPVLSRRLVDQFARFAALSSQRPHAPLNDVGEWALFCETVFRADTVLPAPSGAPSIAAPDPRLRRIRDYLLTFSDRNVTLDELGRESSLSVSELCRRFTAAYGMGPHRYQLVFRLMNAKHLLLSGTAPSDAALATGFADQSHLGRHFKAMFGLTPGAVAQSARARTF